MEITLINGNPDASHEAFEQYLLSLKKFLSDRNCTVHDFVLRDMDIRYCIGCWDCWWKTPGLCRHKDDAEWIYRAIVASDFLILASPLVAGFVSSLVKKLNDRMIPLIHPYVQLIKKESHHRKRYDHYPTLGLILDPGKDHDSKDVEIVADIYRRFALNFHSDLKFVNTYLKNQEDIIRATCGI